MEAKVVRTFKFSAAHSISGLPSGHKCSRLHGHSYRVEVEIAGLVDDVGMVIDFGELQWIQSFLDNTVDHRTLNDVVSVNPTSELLAHWLWGEINQWLAHRPERERIQTLSVTMSESAGTRATYGRDL
ncbi:6-pyruvoyltetrahydropterin/6-carboxytetrahydropterin synthase [Microbacterium sp. RURRCA19A]|nr:6-pyruvoyltetrahydropterin/6-carboxytetrahydropterin synthase [Microbacterium sp. RURRCA19A]